MYIIQNIIEDKMSIYTQNDVVTKILHFEKHFEAQKIYAIASYKIQNHNQPFDTGKSLYLYIGFN